MNPLLHESKPGRVPWSAGDDRPALMRQVIHSEAKIVGNKGLQRLADVGRAAGGLVTKWEGGVLKQ